MKKTNEELKNISQKKLKRKSIFTNNKAITLISLVITIVLLIILAGIAINLGLKENGLLSKAKFAKDKYINEQENEKKGLNDLYSEVLVATGENSQITISGKELKELIKEEVQKSTQQPTGIKTDTFITNKISTLSSYTNIASISNLCTKGSDENNKIQEYLSYSDETGYTVLKSGWYFFETYNGIWGADYCDLYLSINNKNILLTTTGYTGETNTGEHNNNNFSIYLKENDIIYFLSTKGGTAAYRSLIAKVYPMF